MKELTHIEVEQVSGAGVIADGAEALGQGIGALVDSITGSKGSADIGAIVGKTVGSVAEIALNVLDSVFGHSKHA
ncbi:hypothetical protein Z042_24625 [Chania multitudinisentens RB-25]|uniref:Uncharacterized protein n=1 Tax=Chania multitudinisentens RB-25 TaxID=1441930 RepID=W0LF05_9GAMM|nr:hypothetical protein [Chania multitudinisentens]AHG22438.1 hypothetical protein Z042_24625 [Chania multitudinisentens RB-25]